MATRYSTLVCSLLPLAVHSLLQHETDSLICVEFNCLRVSFIIIQFFNLKSPTFMQNKKGGRSILQFMSICFREDDRYELATIARRPFEIDQNDDYIKTHMGRISLHFPQDYQLCRALKMALNKVYILDSENPVLGVISDYCLEGPTESPFQYILELVRKASSGFYLFDVGRDIDHENLTHIIKKEKLNSVVSVQFKDFKDQRISEFIQSPAFETKQQIKAQRKKEISRLTKEIKLYYVDSILVDSKTSLRYLRHEGIDKIILIPFDFHLFTQIYDPINQDIPFRCKLHLLQCLITYVHCLSKVVLILPIQFQLKMLIPILSLVMDSTKSNIFETLAIIEQVYTRNFQRLHFVVKFGADSAFMEGQLKNYIAHRIFGQERWGIMDEKESIVQSLQTMAPRQITNILVANQNRIDLYLKEMEKSGTPHKRKIKNSLRSFKISLGQFVSQRSLSSDHAQSPKVESNSVDYSINNILSEDLCLSDQSGTYVMVDENL